MPNFPRLDLAFWIKSHQKVLALFGINCWACKVQKHFYSIKFELEIKSSGLARTRKFKAQRRLIIKNPLILSRYTQVQNF